MNTKLNDTGRCRPVWASLWMLVACALAALAASASAGEGVDSTVAQESRTEIPTKRVVAGKEIDVRRMVPRVESEQRDEASDKREWERINMLTAIGNRMKSIAQIDSLKGMSPEDREFLKRRYNILRSLD